MIENCNLSEKAINEINQFGFIVIKGFFSREAISDIEALMIEHFYMQASKIGEFKDNATTIFSSENSPLEKLASLYELLESNDKEAIRQTQKFFSQALAAWSFYSPQFLALMTDILQCDKKRVLIEGPGAFINRPSTTRQLYKWHSESHYYPKRRNFLNIWVPLFTKKTVNNGTMSFKINSHLHNYPFSEYRGYNKDSQGKEHHFIQYEIPEKFLEGHEEFWCAADPGDLVLFHQNLAHRSNPNSSKLLSVALVSRAWDPSNDLTLSANMSATPYTGTDVGRPNLVVSL